MATGVAVAVQDGAVATGVDVDVWTGSDGLAGSAVEVAVGSGGAGFVISETVDVGAG